MIVVVDASVVVKWFVKEAGHSLALSLLERGFTIVAPDLIFPETANVLWKKLRMGEVTSEQAESACSAMPDFFAEIVPSQALLGPALSFAQQLDHPVYDCFYLACAERLAVKLVTGDHRFVTNAKSAGLGYLIASLEEASLFGRDAAGAAETISNEDLHRLIALSEQFERTLSFVSERVSQPGAFRIVSTADLGPAFSSPAHLRLAQAVRDLSHDQICDVVALAWLGRGYDGSNWSELRKHARSTLGDDPLRHLNYIMGLLYYLGAGVEKIRSTRSEENPPVS